MVGLVLAASEPADAAPPATPCKQACSPSEACSPQGTCVSKCNPGCASNELCSPDGACVSACNPGCASNEACSPDRACVSKCNPACSAGGVCRADGTCDEPPPAAPAGPRPVVVAPPAEGDGETKPAWALFGVGTGLFVASWITTGVAVTVICNENAFCDEAKPPVSFVPVAGPIVVLGMGENTGEAMAALVAAETLQVAGITLAIIGLVVEVPSNDARAAGRRFANLPFQLTPVAGPDLVGVGAHGSF